MNKYNKALRYEIFENKEYWFLENIIKESKVVFDIWWHVWYFSEYCLRLNKDLFIHFFEPVKEFLDEARGRIDHNKIYRNNSAIMNNNWFHHFFVNSEKSMQSSIFNNTFLNPVWIRTKVIIERLDDYIDSRKIEKINLLKMDIEWSEFDVINNMWDNHLDMIDNICIEYHILDKDFEKKMETTVDKLKNIYKNLDIIPSKYTPNIWYIFAKKQWK